MSKLLLFFCMTLLLSSCNQEQTDNEVKQKDDVKLTFSNLEISEKLSATFEQLAKDIAPSVVQIKAVGSKKKEKKDEKKEQELDKKPEGQEDLKKDEKKEEIPGLSGIGTGFIIDYEGRIITNYHVVMDAEEIYVQLSSGKKHKATLLKSDPPKDLALLQLSNNEEALPARLGDSDKLSRGQLVLAMGNPFGLDYSVSTGVISGLGRAMHGKTGSDNLIQTDAAINPGNSGGPLCNLKGEVIGINSAIFSRTGGYMGIGFSIPINEAKKFAEFGTAK